MAITKIGAYRNPPEDTSDFQAINELLMAYARDLGGQGMILTEWINKTDYPKLAMGSYLFHGGSSYLVDTEDYDIGTPGNGTYYLRIAASGETLAVSWISSLSGYAWNPIYNGLYHPDESQVLPYQLIVSGANKEKWKIANLAQAGGFIRSNWEGSVNATGFMNVGGAIKGTHINTGDGDFKIGQNLRTTDPAIFTTVNTGHGANELYPMNQAVRTDSDVKFATVDTGFGANELYRNSYQSMALSNNSAQTGTVNSMLQGETRYFYCTAWAGGGYKRVYLPSGGTYFVMGIWRWSDDISWKLISGTRTSPYHWPAAGILSGGTSLFYISDDERDTMHVMYIIRRIA